MPDTIVSAAAALRDGTTTAAGLVRASFAAIELHAARTNAFVTIDRAGAEAAAEAMDRERARGIDRGPLHGIPISLKDLIDVAGVVTTAGSRVLSDRTAPQDAEIVTRLAGAGAIVIGRTNMHEFALGTTSEDSAFGAVRHPLDEERSAGGSSGGSAAAVLTRMGLGSVGTDTGGSVRIPSAACGIVGLKPSFGEIPTTGVIPLSPSLDHVGPIAKTVADAALLFAVLAGLEPAIPATRPIASVRLRRLGGYLAGPLDATVRRALDDAMRGLKDAGAHVLDGEIAETSKFVETYSNIVLAEAAQWHARYLDTRPESYTPPVRARIEHGRTISAVSYLEAKRFCRVLRSAVDAALEGCDALVLPTLPFVAPLRGTANVMLDASAGESVPVRAAMLKHTQLFNLTGHPAISLPIATNCLPVGLQLVGRIGETRHLLETAAACEPFLRPR